MSDGHNQLPYSIRVLINTALRFRDCGQYHEAVSFIENELKGADFGDIERSALLVSLGTSYKRLNDTPSAKKHFSDAIHLNPTNIYALNELGQCYLLERNIEEAEQYFKRVLNIHPENPYALVGLKQCRQKSEGFQRPPVTIPNEDGFVKRTPRFLRRDRRVGAPSPSAFNDSFVTAASSLSGDVPTSTPTPSLSTLSKAVPSEKLSYPDRLKADIEANPRQIGLYERLIPCLLKAGLTEEVRIYAEKALEVDRYNAVAKSHLRRLEDDRNREVSEGPLSRVFAKEAKKENGSVLPLVVAAMEQQQGPEPEIVPTPAPREDLVPMDEVTLVIRVGGKECICSFMIPPSDEPLRVSLIDPALTAGEGKGFVVARGRSGGVNREPK